jgi:hypothetical protein
MFLVAEFYRSEEGFFITLLVTDCLHCVFFTTLLVGRLYMTWNCVMNDEFRMIWREALVR